MGIIGRVAGFLWRRWADYNSLLALLDILDAKTVWSVVIAWVAMILFGSTNTGWSPQAVVIGAFVVAACVAVIVVVIRLILLGAKSTPWRVLSLGQTHALEVSKKDLIADVGARDPYFRILAGSAWKDEQLRTTTDTRNLRRDWLEFRFKNEIHKALRNERLASWGEECLHGMVTTPEKPIPPDAWDKIELEFDSNPNLPRTSAYFKGPTTFQKGKSAWNGVKFNEAQFFQLFPLGARGDDWRPMCEAVAHVATHISDNDAKGRWPSTRTAIRQRAFDSKIRIRGQKSAEFMGAGLRWSEIQTDIPSSYWETADIGLMATAQEVANDDAPQTFPHRYSDGRFGSDRMFLYARLRVSWADLLKEWP
jgi:hypothetical protein